jgi:hypothetical protein
LPAPTFIATHPAWQKTQRPGPNLLRQGRCRTRLGNLSPKPDESPIQQAQTDIIARTVNRQGLQLLIADPSKPVLYGTSIQDGAKLALNTETRGTTRLSEPNAYNRPIGVAPQGLVVLDYCERIVDVPDPASGKRIRRIVLERDKDRTIPVAESAAPWGDLVLVPGSLFRPCVLAASLADGRVAKLTAPGMRRPSTCCVSLATNRLYVADKMADRVYAFDLRTIAPLGEMEVKDEILQIAPDPVTKRIYFFFECGEIMGFQERR